MLYIFRCNYSKTLLIRFNFELNCVEAAFIVVPFIFELLVLIATY